MYLKLQILFAILYAVFVAVAIPVGVALGLMGAVICAGLAFIFYLVMLTFKLKHASLNPTEDKAVEKQSEKTPTDGSGEEKGG